MNSFILDPENNRVEIDTKTPGGRVILEIKCEPADDENVVLIGSGKIPTLWKALLPDTEALDGRRSYVPRSELERFAQALLSVARAPVEG